MPSPAAPFFNSGRLGFAKYCKVGSLGGTHLGVKWIGKHLAAADRVLRQGHAAVELQREDDSAAQLGPGQLPC